MFIVSVIRRQLLIIQGLVTNVLLIFWFKTEISIVYVKILDCVKVTDLETETIIIQTIENVFKNHAKT